jgi:hypothetical protein
MPQPCCCPFQDVPFPLTVNSFFAAGGAQAFLNNSKWDSFLEFAGWIQTEHDYCAYPPDHNRAHFPTNIYFAWSSSSKDAEVTAALWQSTNAIGAATRAVQWQFTGVEVSSG